MHQALTKREIPEWLAKLDPEQPVFSIRDVLSRSLYYGASSRDGDPVRYLGGFVHSFIYVDFVFTRDEVWNSLHHEHRGFKGYDLVVCRDISLIELVPDGWVPINPDISRDGNPLLHFDWWKERFAIWAILERKAEFGEDFGPERLSFLYINGDAVATFQALYHGNRRAPEVVAIIQPGLGFGGNWTDFHNPEKIFGRSVLQNPHGKPNYILYGGWGRNYRPCCWPDYDKEICDISTMRGHIGLWRAPWAATEDVH